MRKILEKTAYFMVLICALSFFSPNAVATNITFINAYTSQEISDVSITIMQEDSATKVMENIFLEKNTPFIWDSKGEFIFYLDDPTTKGTDYAGIISTKTNEENNQKEKQTVPAFPSATIQGLVKDKLNNVVNKADIKFDCQNKNALNLVFQSDQFGSFKKEAVPIGSCRIFASYKNTIGISEVMLKTGDFENIEIILNKTSVPQITQEENNFLNSSEKLILLLSLTLIILVVIFLFFLDQKKKKRTRKKEPEKKKNPQNTTRHEKIRKGSRTDLKKRREDIILTLSEKEQVIVKFLLEQKEYKTTQSKLRYGTGIPKTSLTRTVNSLEAKNIVLLNKIGNLVKIKLSPWFLKGR